MLLRVCKQMLNMTMELAKRSKLNVMGVVIVRNCARNESQGQLHRPPGREDAKTQLGRAVYRIGSMNSSLDLRPARCNIG